jgi:GTP-dependent phosphoenolpyruvate carboxykinase
MALDNPRLHRFVADTVELCEPDSMLVFADSADDVAMTRNAAVESRENT